MKVLDEIIDLAAGDNSSASTLLRKCLVLAHTLRNDRLKVWVENELNGYKTANDDEVPEYRKTSASAKGLFIGPFGRQINHQPIPPAILQEQHRHFAESMVLFQPIASYEGVGRNSNLIFDWPANLIVIYQASFFEGRYVLNRAWQEVPGSVFVGLIDTIRTRVLRFALELRDDLGLVSGDPKDLPKESIDQQIITYIIGGSNVIASKDFTQINAIEIPKDDWAALADALDKRLGVGASAITDLRSALDHDSTHATTPGIGRRTGQWLKDLGKKSGGMALRFGVEVAKREATNWITQYLGHHAGN